MLGLALPEALGALRAQRRDYRCVEVSGTDEGVVIGLPETGIRLHFDQEGQRLRLVEVYDPSRLLVRRRGPRSCAHP